VRRKTGKESDGTDLMHFAMSVKNPIIILGDSATETGRSMQQGYMEIFAGTMTGIRNPKAHENITIDRVRCVHFLFLASMLMSKLDEAAVDKLADPTKQRVELTREESLRSEILLKLAHATGGKTHTQLASDLGIDAGEIRPQLDILQHLGLVKLSTSKLSCDAKLTPKGYLEVEGIKKGTET